DERLALPQAVDDLALGAVLVVIAGVEVREDRARLVACGLRGLDDVLDLLARLLGGADVLPGRAELARQRRAPRPVEAAVRYVNAEIVPLQHADAAHLDPARRLARVP